MAKHTKRNKLRKINTRRNKLRKNKSRKNYKTKLDGGGIYKLQYELKDRNNIDLFKKKIIEAYEITQKIDEKTPTGTNFIPNHTNHTVSFTILQDHYIKLYLPKVSNLFGKKINNLTKFAKIEDVYNEIINKTKTKYTFNDVSIPASTITIHTKSVDNNYNITINGKPHKFQDCTIKISLDVSYIRDQHPSSFKDLKYNIPNYSLYGIPNEYKALYNYTSSFTCVETYLSEIKSHYTLIEKYYSDNNTTNPSLIPINVYDGFVISKETLKWLNEFLQPDIKKCIKYNELLTENTDKYVDKSNPEPKPVHIQIDFNIIIDKQTKFENTKNLVHEYLKIRTPKLLCNPISCILPRSNMNIESSEYKQLSDQIPTLMLYTTIYRDYVELIMNHYLLIINDTIIKLKKLCEGNNNTESLEINETITHSIRYVGEISFSKLTLSEVECIYSKFQSKAPINLSHFMNAIKKIKNVFQNDKNDEYIKNVKDIINTYREIYNPILDYQNMKYDEIKTLINKVITIEDIKKENTDIINKSITKIQDINTSMTKIQDSNTNIDVKPTINISTDYFIQFFNTKKAELDKSTPNPPPSIQNSTNITTSPP